jgi:hypothetical protein
MNFVPLLLVHFVTLPALSMLMIARWRHVTAGLVSSPAAQILPASSKVYHMNFVPLLLHFV